MQSKSSKKGSDDDYYRRSHRRSRSRSRSSCFDRCMRNSNRSFRRAQRKCDNRCFMDEEDIIDLFYETGGFAVMPTDEQFEVYLGESIDGDYEEEE